MMLKLYKNILIHKELHTWTGVNLVHSIANANSTTLQINLGCNRPLKNWVLPACSGRTAVSLLMNPWKLGLLSQSWSWLLLVRSLCCIAAVLLLGGIVHCSRGGASNILCKDGGTERTLLQWNRLILLCCTVIIPESTLLSRCSKSMRLVVKKQQANFWTSNISGSPVRSVMFSKITEKPPQRMSSKSKRC